MASTAATKLAQRFLNFDSVEMRQDFVGGSTCSPTATRDRLEIRGAQSLRELETGGAGFRPAVGALGGATLALSTTSVMWDNGAHQVTVRNL